MPLRACSVVERSSPYLSPRPSWKRQRELHARPSGYEPDEVTALLSRKSGAPRSARTFVSSSSGKRLSCLSYRGKIGTPRTLAAPAVRLELTVGDLGDLRRSHRRGYGAPSWTRTNIVGLEGRLPGPSAGARSLIQTEPHSEVGQGGRTCTCGFRVPSSAVCY